MSAVACRDGGHTMRVVARVRSDFAQKFGIPRQSGLVDALRATIVFEPAFRNPDALRGIEGFSHLWLIWQFSEAVIDEWLPLVRPPRLGGDEKRGVFATRSPFRPNPLGLSCVRLVDVELDTPDGPVLHVAGADLMDGSPIYDIKPYLPYSDSHPEAAGGFFTSTSPDPKLHVEIPEQWRSLIPPDRLEALQGVLALDPRPPYQRDAQRVYGVAFAGVNVRFRVDGDLLTVCEVTELGAGGQPD